MPGGAGRPREKHGAHGSASTRCAAASASAGPPLSTAPPRRLRLGFRSESVGPVLARMVQQVERTIRRLAQEPDA